MIGSCTLRLKIDDVMAGVMNKEVRRTLISTSSIQEKFFLSCHFTKQSGNNLFEEAMRIQTLLLLFSFLIILIKTENFGITGMETMFPFLECLQEKA